LGGPALPQTGDLGPESDGASGRPGGTATHTVPQCTAQPAAQPTVRRALTEQIPSSLRGAASRAGAAALATRGNGKPPARFPPSRALVETSGLALAERAEEAEHGTRVGTRSALLRLALRQPVRHSSRGNGPGGRFPTFEEFA